MGTSDAREIVWASRTRKAIRGFPESVRAVFGRALYKAQQGKRHEVAHPMKGSLRGVIELVGEHSGDTYRLYYTLKCSGWVCVLYCHKKKSKHGIQLPKHERAIIEKRLKDALIDCRERQGGPT